MDKLFLTFIGHCASHIHIPAYITRHISLLPHLHTPPPLDSILSRCIMLVLALLALRMLSTVCACLYPRTHAPGPHIPWGFSGEHGPLVWAGLPARYGSHENWTACRLGRYQSPIVLYTATMLPIPHGALTVAITDVPSGKAVLENLGTTLEVPAHDGGELHGALMLSVAGEPAARYSLLQFHFHTPSEHRVDEEYYPLEMHLVFQSADSALAVVGVFFQLGPTPNALLNGVFANLEHVTDPHTNASTGALAFAPLVSRINSGEPVYTYNGSLTTPPCTEGVRWFLLRDPEPLTVDLYNAVKKVMKFNARYTQNAPGKENLLEIARHIGNRADVSAKELVIQS